MANHYDPQDDAESFLKEITPSTAEQTPEIDSRIRQPVKRYAALNGTFYMSPLEAIRQDVHSAAAEVSNRALQKVESYRDNYTLDSAVDQLMKLLDEYKACRIANTGMHPSRFGEKK